MNMKFIFVCRSSILRWTPEAQEEINQNGAIQCGVMIIAIGQTATSKLF